MEQKNITFCQSDLPCASFAAFEDMRRKGELCDFTIKVQNYSIAAHRVIVAAAIPYFRSMFVGGAAETKGTDVDDLDPRALESLIHFAYGNKVTISDQNVQSLLVASHFLQLIQVRDACVEFLSETLHINNVVQVSSLARSLNNLNLLENSYRYIRSNFEEFAKSDDFLKLSHSVVKKIISDDDLNVSREEIVFEAVINWVTNSSCERHTAMLPELLSEVRMIHIPAIFFVKNIASHPLVAASKPCSDLIDEVKNYHILPKETSLFPNLIRVPRKPSAVQYDLTAVCVSRIGGISVNRRDSVNETWQNLASLPVKNTLVYHVVSVNEKIYLFLAKTVQVFDVKTREWTLLEPRHQRITYTTIVSFGNTIYCFGSCNDAFVDKVRRFDTLKNTWLQEHNMSTSRGGAAATVLGESVYVMGGMVPTMSVTATVEKYDPVRGQWTPASSMLTPRSLHACTSMKGKIYVCGGITSMGERYSSSAEMYDPLTDQWNYISSMKIGLRCCSLVSHNGQVHVLGGSTTEDCPRTLDTAIYDPQSDQWISSFPVPEGFQCAVLTPSAVN